MIVMIHKPFIDRIYLLQKDEAAILISIGINPGSDEIQVFHVSYFHRKSGESLSFYEWFDLLSQVDKDEVIFNLDVIRDPNKWLEGEGCWEK